MELLQIAEQSAIPKAIQKLSAVLIKITSGFLKVEQAYFETYFEINLQENMFNSSQEKFEKTLKGACPTTYQNQPFIRWHKNKQ